MRAALDPVNIKGGPGSGILGSMPSYFLKDRREETNNLFFNSYFKNICLALCLAQTNIATLVKFVNLNMITKGV